MAEGSNVSITISGDAKQFKKSVDDARKLLSALDSKVEESGGIGQAAFASFLGNTAADAASKFFSLAVDGVKRLISAGGDWINAAAEQEAAQAKLNFALANTGKFTEGSVASFKEFASTLQANSTAGDEVILKNAALIQSYANLSENGLKLATAAALDMSVAIGIDFEAASKLMGKAADGNVEALARYGIQVENTGNKTRDFETALAAIQDKFGGAALAATNTFAGAQTQLANAFSDLEETMGGFVTGNPLFVESMKIVTKALVDLEKYVSANGESITKLVNYGFRAVVDMIPPVVNGILFIAEGFVAARNAIDFFTDSDAEDHLQMLQGKLETMVDGFRYKTAVLKQTITEEEKAQQAALVEKIAIAEADVAIEQNAANEIEKIRKNLVANTLAGTAQFVAEQRAIIDEADAAEFSREEKKKEAKLLAMSEDAALDLEIRAFKEQQLQANYAKDLEYMKGKLSDEEVEQIASNNRKLIAEGKYQEADMKMRAGMEKAKRADIWNTLEWEKMTQREKLAFTQNVLSQTATLMSSSNDTLFGIGKAFAIADATVKGVLAVQNALASVPFPFNIGVAALMGTVAAVNVAKIASTKKPTAALDGALVTGGTYGKDTEPFMLSKGEVVAPARSFDEVVEGTARQRGFVKGDEQGQGQGQGQSINITINGDFLADDSYIDRLADRLADAVQYRNGPLAVRA